MNIGGPPSPAQEAGILENEVETIRIHLADLVGELDYRRHQLFNLRRHPVTLVLAAAAAATLLGGGIALLVRHRRRRRSLLRRALRFRSALDRMSQHPERVARETPNVPRKILAAGGTTLASLVAKRLATRMFSKGHAAHGSESE
jgi:hypothetical protein